MERRQLLKRAGLVGGAAIGGGTVGIRLAGTDRDGDGAQGSGTAQAKTPRAGSIRNADAFDNVVDAVRAGVDPSGTEPINDFLDRYAGDGTLLAFPPGTYRLDPIHLSGHTDLAIGAAYDEPPTFVASEGYCVEGGSSYVQVSNVDDFLLDGVTFDFDVPLSGGVVRLIADGDATLRDVTIAGSCSNQVAMFRADVLSADATATVERLRLHNRSDASLTGAYVGEDHAGEITFRDCRIEGFSDNGLYASAPGLDSGAEGVVHVENGVYRNNNIANVRLGSDGSTLRGVRTVNTEIPPTNSTGPRVNVRGIRLRNGRDLLVEDCSVHIAQTAGFSYGGIVFHKRNAGTTVRNTTIEIDRDGTPAIRTFPYIGDREATLLFEDVEIAGDAGYETAVRLEGRDGVTFRNCTIEQTGEERAGMVLRNATDCRIVDCRIETTAAPIRLENAAATVLDTTLVTPEGTRHVDELEATDGSFTVEDGS
jgi:hypothetical protein